jgi:chemotaxis protein methyltransferase CheR
MNRPPAFAGEAGGAGAGIVAGEFLFTAKDFGRIAAIMHEEAGISLPESKVNLVYSRLAKRLRALGMQRFSEYCSLVGDPSGGGDRDMMIAALTTNVTRFFREPHHFEHLKTQILPPLITGIKQGQRVRLWSSACSSGQEPYSMALTLLGLLPDAANYDVRILATDIDPNMIAFGKEGVYDRAALEPVPASLCQRWFTAERGAGTMSAGPELRTLVAFKKLNLIGDWPLKGRFNAIFCRNVAIYFEKPTQATIWARLAKRLEPEGALYIGHSERVTGEAEAWLRPDGITTYRPLPAGPLHSGQASP